MLKKKIGVVNGKKQKFTKTTWLGFVKYPGLACEDPITSITTTSIHRKGSPPTYSNKEGLQIYGK